MNNSLIEPLEARIAPATLSIASLETIPEGDSGTTTALFEVTLSDKVPEGATVHFAFANGSAQAGVDYEATSGTLTFGADDLEKTISVSILGDLLAEGDETFTVTLDTATNATIDQGTATGTIKDNDPKVQISNVSVSEGNGGPGATFVDFVVSLSTPSPQQVSVSYATADDSAIAGADYDQTSGTLVFAPTETEKTVRVTVNGDLVGELDETFLLKLSQPINGELAGAQAVGTLLNDDPSLKVADAAALEAGVGGTTFAEFTVTLEKGTMFPVTVNYQTTEDSVTSGKATQGLDYTATSGTLTFTGNGTQLVRVPILGDTASEGKETFLLQLATASNATIVDGSATGNIFDDERNVVSVSDAFLAEADSGQAAMVFVVTLQHAASTAFTIPFSTQDGTAVSVGTDPDFIAQQGTLSFSAGETAKIISVPIRGDVLTETTETFKLLLSSGNNPNDVFVLDAEGVGSIGDNDPAITVGIADVRVAEGNIGETKQALFTVRLSDRPTQTVTVKVSTADGSATSGGADADFQGFTDRLLTFNPGDPLEQQVAVTILGDNSEESDEQFSVRLSDPAGGHLGADAQAGAVIGNDETTLSINDPTVVEGTGGTKTLSFVVSLSKPASQPITVNFQTVDGTAVGTGTFPDFATKTESLTFGNGETTKTVSVVVESDSRDEPDESFVGRLVDPTNATIVKGDGAASITDDDEAPLLSVADVSVIEGNAGAAQSAVFKVRLSAPTEKSVTVKATTVNGSATAGEDFTAVAAQEITFAAGETEKTVEVRTIGDDVDELNETFTLQLSEAQFVVAGQPAGAVQFENDGDTATGTIVNDERALSVADSAVLEGDSGTAELRFTVTLSQASAHPVTVQFATSDGTAVATGSLADYISNSGAITFAPNETSKEVVVIVRGDERNESNETINLTLSSAENAVIADGAAVGTVTNDEVTFRLVADGSASIDEESGTTPGVARFHIERLGGGTLDVPVSVRFATQDGTATATGARPDYTAQSRLITFRGDEQQSAVFEIPLLADDRHESNETFKVVLSDAVNSSVAEVGGQLEFTINDNDSSVPTVTVDDATVMEGDGGTKTVFFDVRLSAVNEANPVQIKFQLEDGSARSVGPRPDYQQPTAQESTLTFAPGEVVKRISVQVVGDLVDELDNAETFVVRLTEAKLLVDGQPGPDVAFTNGDNSALGTIQDNDVATLLFALTSGEVNNGVSVGEGTGGETVKTFTVKLSHETESAVTANVITVDGTALHQTDLGVPDVTPSTLTFAAFADEAARSQSVTVRITGDAIDETNETFDLRLTGASGAVVDETAGQVKVVIVDDDPAPALTINSASIVEGNSGSKDLVFTVTLTGATEQVVTFDFTTAERTPGADERAASSSGPAPDFQETKGSREFRPGEPTTQEIRVPIFGDTFLEGTTANRAETFEVRLSNPVNAIAAAAIGVGTIVDDNDSIIGIAIKDRAVAEGTVGATSMQFAVELSGQTDQPVTFTASTRSGTAATGADFTRLQDHPIIIAAGQSAGTVPVTLVSDDDFEGGATEHFFVILDDVSANARVIDGEARGTIYNDDLLQVNARTIKFIDTDGDVATIHVSQGILTIANGSLPGVLTFSGVNAIGGRSLQLVDFVDRPEFANASIFITAQKQNGFPGGLDGAPSDGRADVGFIRAAVVQNSTLDFTRGLDLGTVFVDGDLGKIIAGDKLSPSAVQQINAGTFGVGKVAVPSNLLDDFGARTSATLTAINRFFVHGNFEGNLRVIGESFGNIFNLRIDGALKGGDDGIGNATGQVFFTGVVGKARLGSIIGGGTDNSGVLSGDFSSGARIGRVKVAGDITGGEGASSGLIVSRGIKSVHVNGSIEGGAGSSSGAIISGGALKTLRIDEHLLGATGAGSGTVQVTGNAGSIRLGNLHAQAAAVDGGLTGGAGDNSGRIQINGAAGSIRIFGSVKGGTGNTTGGVDVGGHIRTVDILGDIRGGDSASGGTLSNSGFIAAFGARSVVLGGDLVAGTNHGTFLANSGAIRFTDSASQVTIKGDLIGNDTNAAVLSAGGVSTAQAFKHVSIFGQARFAEILAGYSPVVTGTPRDPRGAGVNADAQIGSVFIGGNVEATNIVAGAASGDDNRFGTADDKGIVRIPNGPAVVDEAKALSRIARVIIGGSAAANGAPYGIVAQHVVSVTMGAAATPATLIPGPGNDVATAPEVLLAPNFRVLELPVAE